MKGFLMKYFLICMLILSSCSKTEEPKVEPPKPVLPVDQGVIVDQELQREAPMGEDCEKYFPEDALKNEENFTDGIYVAEKIYTAIKLDRNNPTALMMQLGYIKKTGSLHLFVHTLGSPICYENKSPMVIRLPGDNDDSVEYKLKGLHKAHCGTAKRVEDPNKSFTLFELPIDSFFYQEALDNLIKDFMPISVSKNTLPYVHYSYDHSLYFRNGLRCAYRAMGQKHYIESKRYR